MSPRELVRLEGVEVEYRGGVPGCCAAVRALSGVTLSVRRGDRIAVVGPARSGKSTLLACIGGVVTPTRGTVTFGATGERPVLLDSPGGSRTTPSSVPPNSRTVVVAGETLGACRRALADTGHPDAPPAPSVIILLDEGRLISVERPPVRAASTTMPARASRVAEARARRRLG